MNLFLALLFFSGLILLICAFFESKRRAINVHQVRLVTKSLAEPLRILHLSDIHFSGSDPSMSRFFDSLGEETYDLIFITGDIFDREEGMPMAEESFKKLKAKIGIYAVFGNHDYYNYRLRDTFMILAMGFRGRRHPISRQPVLRFKALLAQVGVKLLVNERVEFQHGGQTFSIFGLDDPTTGRADMEKTMHEYNPAHINLLLTHTIDAFFYIGKNEMDLSFSGHSHGGQVQLPFVGAVVTHTLYGPNYVEGIKNVKGAICSISRGVGVSRFLPFRWMAPAEAIVLEVTSSVLDKSESAQRKAKAPQAPEKSP